MISKFLRDFCKSHDGNAAFFLSLSLLPLIVSVGCALDYARAMAARTALQTALDSAVLAAIQMPEAQRSATASRTLAAAFHHAGASEPTATWTTGADGSFRGQASTQENTSFMQIVRIKTLNVAANAAAMKRGTNVPSTTTFKLTYAYGWYWKRVTLWSHEPGNAQDTLRATFTYQPTDLLAQAGRGTGTVTGPINQAITVGSTYDKLYLKMEVSTDGCAPGYMPTVSQTNADFSCKKLSNGQNKAGSQYVWRTDDPKTAEYLYVNGTRRAANTPASALQIFSCGESVKQEWEDGGGSWAQDIGFTVTATCLPNLNYASSYVLTK